MRFTPDAPDRSARPPANKHEFKFLPVPEFVKGLIRDGKLKPLDGIVLGMMLREPRSNGSCSAHRCTRRKIAAELGRHSQTIYYSFSRLKRQELFEHFAVDCPDPDNPCNSTGFRIRFPWIKRADVCATRTTGRYTDGAPGATRMERPPLPALLYSTRGELLRENLEKYDDDGYAGAARGSSSSFSSQTPKTPKQTAVGPGVDQAELDALTATVVEMFGWDSGDARARILGEVANGHGLAKIGATLAAMKEQRPKIRRWGWGWIYKTLKATGPNGPPPSEKPRPPAAPASHQPYVRRSEPPRKPPRPGYLAELRKAYETDDQARIAALEAEAEADQAGGSEPGATRPAAAPTRGSP